MLFDLEELDEAAAIVARHMPPTPQLSWPLLDAAAGTEVWVKHENHTPIGAFKLRGGLVYLDRLARAGTAPNGVISATRGNHGQSLAYAARANGLGAVIVVPEGNNPDKNDAMEALGAELVVAGEDFDEARVEAGRLAEERDLAMVPPFHPELALGVATYARELFESVPDLDTIYVPIGMGSGAAAMVTVRDLLALDTEIVGVVAAGAPAMALSVAAGHVVTTERVNTFVDGVACRQPDRGAFDLIAAGCARIVTVPDEETVAAMRLILRATHNLVEPAGAIGLAALLAERERLRGRRVAFVLTGGNVDAGTLASVLAAAPSGD